MSVQMTWLSAAMTTTAMAVWPAGRTAQVERIHQVVKTFREQLVDLVDHTTQLGAIEVAFHEVNHIVDQHVALCLHDVSGRGAYKQHHEIIA